MLFVISILTRYLQLNVANILRENGAACPPSYLLRQDSEARAGRFRPTHYVSQHLTSTDYDLTLASDSRRKSMVFQSVCISTWLGN
jgi:hypothetical protein